MTISISELEAIERAMTPGEYTYNDNTGDIESRTAGPTPFLSKSICQMYFRNCKENHAGLCAARNALPELLAIAKAALAWSEQRATNVIDALTKTDEELASESIEVRRARVKRTADLARAIDAALKAVRP